MKSLFRGLGVIAAAALGPNAHAQWDAPALPLDASAIAYDSVAATDAITRLRSRIERGEVRLHYDERSGYLRSLLDALDVPVESQILVYSKTSLQSPLIGPHNPRAIYFNDSVFVAWVHGGFVEIAAHDPRQGAHFYVLQQTAAAAPSVAPDGRCLKCHYSNAALGVPGFLVRSVPTAADGSILPWLGNAVPSHATPIEERWGGWYVTGRIGASHLGNRVLEDARAQTLPQAPTPVLGDLTAQFDTSAYPTPYSDVAALLVFNHQVRMLNLLTRLGWEARIAAAAGRPARQLAASVRETVDYMLFVDEAPLRDVESSSGFVERFAAGGPTDARGRSLRQLDLRSRLLRYPCSWLIYTEAFDALPDAAKAQLYRRLWEVLSGAERDSRYARLTAADRQAIIEILGATKPGLPDYFRPSRR